METSVPARWFDERLTFRESRDVRDPDEWVLTYSQMIASFVEHLKASGNLSPTDPEHQGFARWLSGQIHDMVKTSRLSSSICAFSTGPERIVGHEARQGAIYSKIDVGPDQVFYLHEAEKHFVPADCPEDMLPGFPDSHQLFFTDEQNQAAFSSRQVIKSLLAGGEISLHPREASLARPPQ